MTVFGHHQLPAEEFKQWLNHIDTDGDGRISKQELAKALGGQGFFFKRWKARRAVAKVDTNGNGVIDGDFEMAELIEYAQKHWGFVFTGK